MKLRYIIPIVTFLLLVTLYSSAQTGESEYDLVIVNEYTLGVNTNAPKGSDVLNYEYEEIFELEIDVYSLQNRIEPVSNFSFSIRLSKFPNNIFEMKYNYTSQILIRDIAVTVNSIEILGSKNHQLKFQQNSMEVNIIEQFEDSSSKLAIRASIGEPEFSLQPRQINASLPLTFNSFTPIVYNNGFFDFNTWLDIIPLFLLENLVLASLAGVGMLFSGIQLYSGFKGSISEFEEAVMKEEFSTDIKTSAEIVKSAKEGAEIIKDGLTIRGLLSKDTTSRFISKYLLPLIYIYVFFLLSAIALGAFEGFNLIIQMIFMIYATFLTILISIISVIGIFRPKIIFRFGKFIPPSHLILIISSFGFLVVIFNQNLISLSNLGTSISNSLFFIFFIISLIGFGLSSAFSGYYIARVGISWNELLEKIWKRIRIPQSIIYIIRIAATLLFFLLVISRLAKTVAAIITVYSQNEIANNAYLITLAAAYMKNDLTGSIWLVYGILALFVIQGVMQLYLHIIKLQSENQNDLPRIRNYYKILALSIIIYTLNFIFIFYSLNFDLSVSNLDQFFLPIPSGSVSVYDVWNIYLNVAPFKLLIESFLSIGVLLGLPFAIKEMLFVKRIE